MTGCRALATWASAASILCVAAPAAAQRASENAVTAAEDAFGVSVGRETIGLYDPDNVRGFSAVDAGNARLDGLYFDPVWRPSPRLQQAATIRVGIAAQGFLFPAPTGVVDYALRRPGDVAKASGYLSADSYGFLSAEADAELPLAGDRLSLGLGLAEYRESYYNATTDLTHTEALILRWRPSPQLEVLPFVTHKSVYDSLAPPIYLTATETLPPPAPRRRFEGPDWARNRSERSNIGALVRWTPAAGWTVQGGLFRSAVHDPIGFTNLYLDLTPQGRADQTIIVDPDARNVAISGELRASHAVEEGDRRHTLTVSVRGRDRERTYDGSDTLDLGEVALGRAQTAPRPTFSFTAQDHDRIDQVTGGLAYELRWRGVGDLSASVQKTDYMKRSVVAGGPDATVRAAPLLYSVAASVRLPAALTAYASYTRGLEDSGSAPSSAANRNEPLPAIQTSQADAGLRYALSKSLRLVAGVFQVEKPYYEFDAANRFTLLGTQRNRGVELSATGALTPQVDLVAGAVLNDPAVTGDGVRLGLVGRDPVDKPRTRLTGDVEWRPPLLPGITLETALTYVGRRAATTDDRVHIPERTLVDLGVRYAFHAAGRPAQLRLSITNIANVRGFDLYGAGVYDIIAGRVAQLSLGLDF